MLIFSMAVVSPFVISFFLKDLYHCWSLQPPLFFISLYTLYTALPFCHHRRDLSEGTSHCHSSAQFRGGPTLHTARAPAQETSAPRMDPFPHDPARPGHRFGHGRRYRAPPQLASPSRTRLSFLPGCPPLRGPLQPPATGSRLPSGRGTPGLYLPQY